jgi:hypothetical protein
MNFGQKLRINVDKNKELGIPCYILQIKILKFPTLYNPYETSQAEPSFLGLLNWKD